MSRRLQKRGNGGLLRIYLGDYVRVGVRKTRKVLANVDWMRLSLARVQNLRRLVDRSDRRYLPNQPESLLY